MDKKSVNSLIKSWSWPWQFGKREINLYQIEISYGEQGPKDLGWGERLYIDEFVKRGCDLPPSLEVPSLVLKELKAAINALPSDAYQKAKARRQELHELTRNYNLEEAEDWWDDLLKDLR